MLRTLIGCKRAPRTSDVEIRNNLKVGSQSFPALGLPKRQSGLVVKDRSFANNVLDVARNFREPLKVCKYCC